MIDRRLVGQSFGPEDGHQTGWRQRSGVFRRRTGVQAADRFGQIPFGIDAYGLAVGHQRLEQRAGRPRRDGSEEQRGWFCQGGCAPAITPVFASYTFDG